MIRQRIDADLAELIFRLLFCSIFIVLGGEHVFQDDLIQQLMPPWIPEPRMFSLAAGFLLLACGTSISLGYRIHIAATALGIFLVVVTVVIHIPGMFMYPPDLPPSWQWLWDLYQRSNFIKNVCLLGVCFHFLYHEPGRYSLDHRTSADGNASTRRI